ncbi:MAG: hypothetical protein DI539_07180 [Flavobacterium psychrophilum]|nr:MAG: hypothetical protein DI539_07180 [Flavobacterium psychrophilum]
MNYIISQLNRKIDLLRATKNNSELKTHYQAKLELYLNFILGYLWNKNLDSIADEDREYVINTVIKPSIGSIVLTARRLDINSELFGNKSLKAFVQALNDYPKIRNERIGHGFSFEDDVENFLESFEDLIDKIEESINNVIVDDLDLIVVNSKDEKIYQGISFKSNGADYVAWSCPSEVQDFELNSLYIYSGQHGYNRISPFVHIENENEFYMFCAIEEKLTGRVKFNRLIRTGKLTKEFGEFATINVSSDRNKRRAPNGTIINQYEKNYKKYIDVGYTDQIIKFVTKNTSSVFATLWGHGGIGKTASIQNACEILANQEYKKFDYIVFLSAKDRYYNYYKGEIQKIKGNITSLYQIVEYLNLLLFDDKKFDVERILAIESKLLLVIDDFETFSKEEKGKIIDFIKKLNINFHKVILTTRSATLITGEEIETNELDEQQTIKFLIESITNEIPTFNVKPEIKNFNKNSKAIHQITSGRPLFILQFAILMVQKGSLSETLTVDIKTTEQAKNFLYDRIYDYLSIGAKNMFLAISLLVDKDDLTGLISSLKFVLNKEDNEDDFDTCIDELVKLKIITKEDNDFYKVYSPEILSIMHKYYTNKGPEFDGQITNRFLLINNEGATDTDFALLQVADSSRLISSESEVEQKYRYILNRHKTSLKVKLTAITNLSNYLYSQKSKLEKTLKLINDYEHVFNSSPEYIILRSKYHWASGTMELRYKSVQIITEYLSTKPHLKESLFLELLGTLMTYTTNILVNEREQLKEKKRFSEVSVKEYKLILAEQSERFYEIYRYPGLKLYNIVKGLDLAKLTPNCRNYVLDGLTHFSEVCIRINKRDIVKEISSKVFTELSENYHIPFKLKLQKVDYIETGSSLYSTNNLLEGHRESDLSLKLKQAISNRK